MAHRFYPHILNLSIILLITFSSQAQGTITGFSHKPLYPTASDSITFYITSSFTSSDCLLSNAGVSVNGTTVMANALHCVGFAAAICPSIDSFKIAALAVGNYTFQMTLSSGSAPSPCSPGIIPDDTKSYSFSVSPPTNIHSTIKQKEYQIYPNPTKNILTIESFRFAIDFSIYNALGELVYYTNIPKRQIKSLPLNLSTGVYYYTASTHSKKESGKLLIN